MEQAQEGTAAAVWLDPAKLTPWAKNPRDNQHAVASIAESIDRFGFAAPIVARSADLRVIAGHTRLLAAQQLGLERVPVRLLDVSDEEADALALADNRLGELADWNDQGLAEVLDELRAADVSLDGLGWSADELDELVAAFDHELADEMPEPSPGEDGLGDDADHIPEMPPPVCQLGDVHHVGAHTLHVGDCLEVLRGMPSESVDAVVTDPPYGLSAPPDVAEVLQHWMKGEEYQHRSTGFMGAEWDAFVPGPHVWAEVLRVCKPGAHAVVFSSTRTVDLLGIALRLAGWEVRDTIHWTYWNGFPKSLDISSGIDKLRHDGEQVLEVTRWIREMRDAAGLKNAAIDAAFGFNGMASHWCSQKSQPAVPTLEQVPTLLRVLGVEADEVPPEIQRLLVELNGAKGQPGAAWYDRPVLGRREEGAIAGGDGSHAGQAGAYGFAAAWDVTGPASDAAKRWRGYGTHVKPAVEPAILVRKPLRESSIVRQVLATGTGALNIDGARFGAGDRGQWAGLWPGPSDGATMNHSRSADAALSKGKYGDSSEQETHQTPGQQLGRFPANLVHVPKPSRSEREEGLEEQGLPMITGAQAVKRKEGSDGLNSPRAGAGRTAKGVRNVHTTVKPARLMHWLCSLLAPTAAGQPVVLDPYVGSGTTLLGVEAMGGAGIGIELDTRHADIALARIRHATGEP